MLTLPFRLIARWCARLFASAVIVALASGLAFGTLTLRPSLAFGADVDADEATLDRWLTGADQDVPVPYDAVAAAVVALEDRRFWEREGAIDARAVARSAWRDLLALSAVEGASTIEMQLAKLASGRRAIGGGGGAVVDKLRETVLAVRASRKHTKRAFIVAYLDHLPCGAVEGARACAAYLFGEELAAGADNARKAALVAAQANAPTRLHAHPEQLRARASLVHADMPLTELHRDRLAAAPLQSASVLSVGRESARVRELRRLLPLAVRQAQRELARFERAVVVVGAALSGDTVVDVLGNWKHHEMPAGSFAKLWILKSLIEMGPREAAFATDVRLPGRMPAWDLELRAWRPRSVGDVDTPVTLVEAVARSHNATSLAYLYFPFWLAPADADALIAKRVTPAERARFSTSKDRTAALTALSAATGFPYDELPDLADRKPEYRAPMLAMMRTYRDSVLRDLPSAQVPAQPSSLLGSWSARPDEWLHGLARVWFTDASACTLSKTGSALAAHMKIGGTLHKLAAESSLQLAAKTATAPSSIAAAIGFCDDGERVVVVLWAFRPDWQRIPRLQGAQLSSALRMFTR